MEQLAARWAHNPKVVGSSPALATKKTLHLLQGFLFLFLFLFEDFILKSFSSYIIIAKIHSFLIYHLCHQ